MEGNSGKGAFEYFHLSKSTFYIFIGLTSPKSLAPDFLPILSSSSNLLSSLSRSSGTRIFLYSTRSLTTAHGPYSRACLLFPAVKISVSLKLRRTVRLEHLQI